jgi:hypothetical protein
MATGYPRKGDAAGEEPWASYQFLFGPDEVANVDLNMQCLSCRRQTGRKHHSLAEVLILVADGFCSQV